MDSCHLTSDISMLREVSLTSICFALGKRSSSAFGKAENTWLTTCWTWANTISCHVYLRHLPTCIRSPSYTSISNSPITKFTACACCYTRHEVTCEQHLVRGWVPDLDPQPTVNNMLTPQLGCLLFRSLCHDNPFPQVLAAVYLIHELIKLHQSKAMLNLEDSPREPAALKTLLICHDLHVERA